ncbi:MAG: ribosome rescue protein RqcH [Candidatus Nanohaloarchaea archaeon]|nr:ribosome rescue protein RqcH [Candidatus Nanohaloarchaea archaeon]
MKKEISSADLKALMQELRVLEGARIDKFYQRGNELIIHVYKPGDRKYRLFLAPGKAFLSRYKREMPDRPPGFCMHLRKKLGGAVVERVEQYDFDRVLEFHFEDSVLVAELFREGNYVLTNKNREVQAAMRTGDIGGREVHTGERYDYPGGGTGPGEVDRGFLQDFPDDDLVVVLASEAGLGGSYAEEVCARAEVDKKKNVGELSSGEEDRVLDALHGLMERLDTGKLEPRVYHDDGVPVAATPVPFETYAGKEAESYESFSEALDTYFTESEKARMRRKKEEKYEEEKERLEHRLRQQEEKLEGLKRSVDEAKEKADLIYENYTLVEDILDSVRSAREQYSEDEIRERLESERAEGVPEAEAIESLDLGNGRVVVDIGEEVSLELDVGVEKNAERYYEKSKDAKNKLPGLKESLEETRDRLEELEVEEVEVEDKFRDKEEKKAEKKWYEKFRWFFSSDGYLVIGGRDTTTNDMLVKKYMEKNDVYVHAEFKGAPSVVVKNEEGGDRGDIPDSTLEEAGKFAVTFARSWEAGVGSEEAYWVEPEQVTQEAESGEYLPKGSFVIRGDRNYMKNLPVEAAVGAYTREDGVVPMGGPPEAVKHHCDHYAVLRQGGGKKSDVAKDVKSHLDEVTGESLDLDKVMRALPPGESEVAEKH